MNKEIIQNAIGEEVIVEFLSNSMDNCQYKVQGTLEYVDETGVIVSYNGNKIHAYFCEKSAGEAIQKITSVENPYLVYFENPLLKGMDACLWGAYEKPFSKKYVEAMEILLSELGLESFDRTDIKAQAK